MTNDLCAKKCIVLAILIVVLIMFVCFAAKYMRSRSRALRSNSGNKCYAPDQCIPPSWADIK
jgi:heme/copper-type cytochrome/quinol oxidase subunit 2